MTINSFAQTYEEYWDKWNSNYPDIDILRILNYEKHYADSVEKDQSIPQYYGRAAKYRFQASYIGQVRPIDKSIRSSMLSVFKLFIGNPSQINESIDSVVLIKLGEDSLWMPVQKQILEGLKEEVQIGDTLTLYCLYLNEHSWKNGLRNIFVISEFIK